MGVTKSQDLHERCVTSLRLVRAGKNEKGRILQTSIHGRGKYSNDNIWRADDEKWLRGRWKQVKKDHIIDVTSRRNDILHKIEEIDGITYGATSFSVSASSQ